METQLKNEITYVFEEKEVFAIIANETLKGLSETKIFEKTLMDMTKYELFNARIDMNDRLIITIKERSL